MWAVVSAQLKVHLRPVWSPASGALATLASRFPAVVWQLLFSELSVVHSSAGADPSWMDKSNIGEDEEDLDSVREDERTWRDPSAHKVRTSLARWAGGGGTRADIIKVSRYQL